MSEEIVWAKRKTKRAITPLLLARRISKEWLASSFDALDIRFQGALLSTLMDLRDAARHSKKNFPIGSLRLMLQAAINGVIFVEKNLGCDVDKNLPAVTMYRGDDDDQAITWVVCDQISRWHMNSLEPWAQREGFGELAVRVSKAITPDNLVLVQSQQHLCDPRTGHPNYTMIARQIGDRLSGEVLFPGMEACEIILPEFGSSSSLELMTRSRRSIRGSNSFSMVARIDVTTVPYSSDLYFTVSATKRVWAEKMPTGGNTGINATAYVMPPNRPIIPVLVSRKKVDDAWAWEFDDDYSALYNESRQQLPATFTGALQNVTNTEDTWWVGLPQTTRLYSRVAARTVFEGDEKTLLDEIEPRLAGILDGPIDFTTHRVALNGKPSSAMLRAEDFGVAGTAIADDPDEDDGDDEEIVDQDENERDAIAKFREQSIQVLGRIHPNFKPCLWVIGGNSDREQAYIKRAAELLFGDAVDVRLDPLPADVHGLRANLPGKDLKSRLRFDERVKAWTRSGLPAAIARYDGPKYVLICAAKDIGRRSEDPVNRRAAIHAMCLIAGASVHHVLPIEEATSEFRAGKAIQSFVHRAQSAMMDVMLAHSGYIIGAGEFVSKQLGANPPKAIYGIQALRKRAQKYSGETPVCMIIYSRLNLETNVTEIQFGYKEANKTQRSSWMRLADGLIWLGCQRAMQGDEDWLEQEFQGMTTKMLAEVGTSDPRAIVFIDWQTLPRLWKDLTDVSLTNTGKVTIGHADLAATFPEMAFVRLRYGPAVSMSLRAWSETVYEGFRESTRIATGEFFSDAYVTTRKQLIEINPRAGDKKGYAHFVGVMTYPKTTQIPRGLSCYRPTIRITRDKGEKGVFEKKTMDPAEMDAALPTSMDITVMHSPKDIEPAAIATLVMGLRLGYAHYPDWTRLPAPLFFERKIDDYIIKYPASEDIDDIAAAEGDADGVPEVDVSTTVMRIVAELIEKENPATAPDEAPVQQEYKLTSESMQSELLLEPVRQDEPADTGDTDDILAQAKRIDVAEFQLYPPRNNKMRRLYEAMVKKNIDLRVELPYFVCTHGLFGRYEPSLKRRIQKHWNQLIDFAYVPAAGKQRPPNDNYLDWLAGHFVHPQAAYMVDAILLFDRQIIIPEVDKAIARYNATAKERVSLGSDRQPIDLAPVVGRAITEGDDNTLAWLIFAAAQTPSFGIAKSVIAAIDRIIGKKTEAALHYYVNCARACKQAISQLDLIRQGKFPPIHVRINFTSMFPDIEEPADVTTEADDNIATMRASLRRLVDGLLPGNEGFKKDLEQIRMLLEWFDSTDALHDAKAKELEVRKELEARFLSDAQALIDRIHQADDDKLIGEISFTMPELSDTEIPRAISNELQAIQIAVEALEKARADLDKFYEAPLPLRATIAERTRHARQSTLLLDNVMVKLGEMQGAIKAATYFSLSEPPAPDEPDGSPIEELHALEPAVHEVIEALTEAVEPVEMAEVISGTPPEVTNQLQAADVIEQPAAAEPEPLPQFAEEPVVTTPAPSAIESPGPAPKQPVALLKPSTDITQSLGRLMDLVDRRHYALAKVYTEAICNTFNDDEDIKFHAVILQALCTSMDSIDCRFAVDTRLDHGLRELLLDPIRETGLYSSHGGAAIGAMAASLVSMLFSMPATDAADVRWSVIDWVRQPLTGMKSISELVDHIGLIDSKRIMLTREKFAISRVGDKMAQQAETKRSIERAAHWKTDSSIHSGWAHQGYLRMHEHIYGIQHPIGQCLALIAKGDFKSLREAYDKAKRKFDKPQATVVEAFKAVGERNKPDGRYSVNAVENVVITEGFIKECLERHESEAGPDSPLAKHERDYLDTLASLMTAAINELEARRAQAVHIMDAIYFHAASVIFQATLRLFDNTPSDYCIPEHQQRLLIQLPMDKTFMPSMKASETSGIQAICSAEDVMHAIEELVEVDISPLIHPVSEQDLAVLLGDALRLHVAERRFLPAFAISSVLGPSVRLEPSLISQYQKAKADLTRELQDARQRVTHAMALSALTQGEATELLGIIEGLNASNMGDRAIGHPDGPSSAYPDFPHALTALRSQVLQVLDTRLQDTKDKLVAELEQYSNDHGDEVRHDVQRVHDMLDTNNPASLRTAHDACMILRNGGKLPSYALDPELTAPVEFERFIKSLDSVHGHHGMIESLRERLLATDDSSANIECLKHLPPEARAEAADFLQKWNDLCIERSHPVAADLAGQFFASLGIAAPDYLPMTTRNSSRHTRLTFTEKAFSALATNVSFVPPALGSPTQAVIGFVVQGNQPENDISALIQDVTGIPTFILARTRLTLSKRTRMSGHAPVILVDDNLIAYMALHAEDRARRMMEVGTLTFYTQPYSADGTSVPKEMFFGRRRELDSLRNVKSLAILYGGRRLGKSSLLAQIEREMNNEFGTVAIYMPMNRDYHGGDHVTFAWRTLYRALTARSIIETMPQDQQTWQPIRNWIEQQLTSTSQKVKSCYLLFDEADDLMAHELDLKADDIGLIGSLHQMVESLQSKINIRYVIAGLHNLTRMTTESNSALGKAEVIALEPFSTDDDILRGIDLITKPMAALGFYFGKGSEDLPLRILSVCNYYPAFIQVYCKKLVEHMYNKRPKDQAVAYVVTSDLDAVEKDHDLLTELQTKFGWTLDLDKRYKAIALILADIYYAEIEVGKNEGLSVGAIREYCQMVAEAHFRGMSFGAYESLVDEMRKLNVLEKHGGNYRLRNPSIAMLIGDRERVNRQLDALASDPPEKTRNQGDRRQRMDVGNAHVLFPMPIAWTTAQMDVIGGDLVIVGGCHLSGLTDLCQTSTDWPLTQNSRFRAMNMSAANAGQVINKYRGQSGSALPKGGKLLLAATPTAWKASEISTFAQLAQKAVAQRIRLALIAGPDRLWEIAQSMKNGTLPNPNQRKTSWQVVPVPAWSVDAVRFHLHENASVSDNTEASEAIIRASCGFTRPIQMICSDKLTREAALRAPEESSKSGFARDLTTFYAAIGWPQAISEDLRKRMEEFLVLAHNEQRGGTVVDDGLQSNELSQEDLLFLNWVGLLQEGDDNTWQVPDLYLNLIS